MRLRILKMYTSLPLEHLLLVYTIFLLPVTMNLHLHNIILSSEVTLCISICIFTGSLSFPFILIIASSTYIITQELSIFKAFPVTLFPYILSYSCFRSPSILLYHCIVLLYYCIILLYLHIYFIYVILSHPISYLILCYLTYSTFVFVSLFPLSFSTFSPFSLPSPVFYPSLTLFPPQSTYITIQHLSLLFFFLLRSLYFQHIFSVPLFFYAPFSNYISLNLSTSHSTYISTIPHNSYLSDVMSVCGL